MNALAPYEPSKSFNSHCADLSILAERELSAFFNAVTQLYGSELAELAAEDWLHELNKIDCLTASTTDWRSITAEASKRLARRVNALALSVAVEFAIA
jgi:hypothetical protein